MYGWKVMLHHMDGHASAVYCEDASHDGNLSHLINVSSQYPSHLFWNFSDVYHFTAMLVSFGKEKKRKKNTSSFTKVCIWKLFTLALLLPAAWWELPQPQTLCVVGSDSCSENSSSVSPVVQLAKVNLLCANLQGLCVWETWKYDHFPMNDLRKIT